LEKELSLRSEALNRMIQNHDDELIELHEETERYKRIALNLVAAIVLVVIVCGYGMYAMYTKGKTTDVIVQPASKDHAYVLKK